jgi:hypothetical protein
MANRRTLKKAIKYVSVDLLTECYLKSLFNQRIETAQLEELMQKINKLNYDLVGRISHTDGKGSPAITRNYYRKLKNDWQKGVEEILKDIEQLGN